MSSMGMPKDKSLKQKTIMALQLLNNKQELVIPPVQRDLVWTTSQKQLLIDSLIKDFDIPKLYFRPIIVDGKTKYEIIDGQQRINAILEFLEDKFSLPPDADSFNGEEIAGKKYSELSSDAQIEFTSRSLDIVHLVNYSDEEMEETFLRLQNGTPLKAPEKRRAIAGNMRNVINTLSQNDVFEKYCSFGDVHFAFEDCTAKVLIQIMNGGPTGISAQALRKMYENNPNIDIDDKAAKATKRAFNFLKKAFKNTDNPHLKKYAVVDLAVIADSLLDVYDLNNYPYEFGKAYIEFSNERILNNELEEDEQNPKLIEYNNSARGDSLGYIEYRQNLLREYILEKMPYLTLKDSNRLFTPDQRAVIYRLGNGVCANCGKPVKEEDFEADHKIPWSKGGKTQIANGQILCSTCNQSKGAK